jgi:hypothetical protein
LSGVSEDGWYTDPAGRHAQRLYLGGQWTPRIRGFDGTESSEDLPPAQPQPDYSVQYGYQGAPPASPVTPSATSATSAADRPSYGVGVAAVGAVLAILGIFVLDWAKNASFFDARNAVDDHSSSFAIITQVYMLALWLPLLIVTVAVGLCATLGPVAARIGTAVAGVLGGVGLVGLVLWVESGDVGTDSSRHDALPLLVLLGIGGILSLGLGIGSFFDKRAYLARGLALVLAVVAAIIQLFVVNDLFQGDSSASFGAWAPALGYALLAVACVLPYRRAR